MWHWKKPEQISSGSFNYLLNLGRVTSEGSRNNVSINRNWLLPTSPCELSEREVTSPSNLKVVGALDNYSLVFVIFINFFGQLKDWVGQVPFLVSCPKGQVEKYVNAEACYGLLFQWDNSVKIPTHKIDKSPFGQQQQTCHHHDISEKNCKLGFKQQ